MTSMIYDNDRSTKAKVLLKQCQQPPRGCLSSLWNNVPLLCVPYVVINIKNESVYIFSLSEKRFYRIIFSNFISV